MSMSCLRIRSSSRSSGPSYTSVTETANGESLSSFFAECRSDCRFGDECTATSAGETVPFTLFSDVTILSSILLSIVPRRRLVSQRHSHRRTHSVHGLGGNRARPFTASLQNIPSQPGILLEFLAPLLHRTQQLHQRIGRPAFALDAADARRPATGVHFVHGGAIAADLVQVAHAAHIRVSRVGTPHPRRVGHHRLQLVTY